MTDEEKLQEVLDKLDVQDHKIVIKWISMLNKRIEKLKSELSAEYENNPNNWYPDPERDCPNCGD